MTFPPIRQILASVITGFCLGIAITLTVHGFAKALRVSSALLHQVYSDYSIVP